MKRKSVMVGMSGGVDSSVAAAILKEQDYRVIGYTLKFGKENNKCCLIDDAKQVAEKLNIEYLTIDISSEFEKKIVQHFIDQYIKGKTPSPCPKCNLFKFGLGIEYARNNNIDYVGTGHYAKIINNRLITASSRKDQAYFLSRLPKRYFEKILLPLGEMKKSEVRKYANKINLHIADKSDSQDICFVEDDYREFLKKRGIKEKEGKVINKRGNVIDTHNGYFNFTIGQRYKTGGLPHKLYVLKTIPEKNTVVVGKNKELFRKYLEAEEFNLIADERLLGKKLFAKVRSRDSFHACKVVEKANNNIKLMFKKGIRAITPGQLAVLYYKINKKEYQVVGSGWIV